MNVCDTAVIRSHSALRASRTGPPRKPGASFACGGGHGLRLGEAPKNTDGFGSAGSGTEAGESAKVCHCEFGAASTMSGKERKWFAEVPPRRAQRRRKHDGLVTQVGRCAGSISTEPRSPPSQGTRLRIGGVSRFLLPTFLCGGKEK